MKQFLITVAGVFSGLLLFLIGLPILLVIVLAGSAKPKEVKGPIVLSLDLRSTIADQRAAGGLAGLSGGDSTVDVVRKLTQAQTDSDVKGLFLRAPEFGLSPAQAEELRAAIKRFRASGKFVYAHAQSFDGASLTSYPAVSAVDILWLQESGDFAISGLSSESFFLGGALEKYKAEADFIQFHEYKNAANIFTQNTFTPAHKEATLSLLNGLYDGLSRMAGEDRGMTTDAFKELLLKAPYSAKDAMTAKLVDHLGWPEDAEKAALDKAGAKARLVKTSDYDYDEGKGPVIALVGGMGAISGGAGGGGLFGDDGAIRSDDTTEAIDLAAKNKDVKAIVFRVDSPGGSATASDQIWSAVERAQKAGKPVVISMGGVAASGGYWVAMGADRIIANETTITGSIGVLGGKIVVEKAINEYVGANTELVSVGGPYASAFSGEQKFTPEQRTAYMASMQRIYDRFITNVASGRNLPEARVREIAKGRVWTGAQAKELGLVDGIGGLTEAIAEAKKLAKIADKDAVQLRVFPRAKPFGEWLEEALGISTESARAARTIAALAGDEQVARAITRLREAREARGVQAVEHVTVH